ncbi:Stp1/IreP family PP2C-type Ser/Thr phosphatase [Knoellia sp. p5-6-4]|uniref:Stp1/IreP family PP2C-type Ser/Thr phosphatase n=1 Tax=unclassified Knoellia TaxID=2618719 RepID=UPI0023D99288|nr:Stp1/IreP family PP2C-type Ser/Thr phosphatase [Knoellia sp. p5-6-4]MDF2145041.1 Stp1/IreP family PP2C-type Ser/Thr phosphatase [Knoellia sp. p5-6-4]
MKIALDYAARSDVGLVRSENQDSGYAGPHLLVVADGMGGHAGGDIASSIAIGRMVSLDGESHGGDDVTDHLVHTLASANAEIQSQIEHTPELQGMGTTVTALLRAGNKVALAHIGDSRAYLLRGGTFSQITHDHSFVQSLVDDGRITEEEADSHPQRSLVTRVLTGAHDDEPDLMVREVRPGDRFLLCSDGLSGFVARDTIEEVLSAGQPVGPTADRLVELAMKAGAPDNVTVVVADVVDLDSGSAPSTVPQVVGAAAQRTKGGTRPVPLTPAAKAAALSREATGAADDDGVTLAEEAPSAGPARWLRRGLALLLVLVVLGGGAYAGWYWVQRQFYVGVEDGQVAIFRGVSQDLGPIRLSKVEQLSSISTADLPDFYRTQVQNTITTSTLADAEERVNRLREEAVRCVSRKAAGGTCGGTSAASSTPTTTTTTTPGPTSPTSTTATATP